MLAKDGLFGQILSFMEKTLQMALSLQAATKVRVPEMPGATAPTISEDDMRISFGDVIVSVEKLDSGMDHVFRPTGCSRRLRRRCGLGRLWGLFFGRGDGSMGGIGFVAPPMFFFCSSEFLFVRMQ